MIDYETANLKDFFLELQQTKKEINERLKNLDKTYTETIKNLNGDAKNLLRYYYESHSVNCVLTDSAQILKIIDNILTDPKVQKHYIGQLKKIAVTDRGKGLGDFKAEWLSEIRTQDYSKIYVQACGLNDWLDDCSNITHGLESFIGNDNPLLNILQGKNTATGKTIYVEPIYAGVLDITIKGNQVGRKRSVLKKVFDPTETDLIYTLYFKYKNNENQCFTLSELAKELEASEGNLKNRLTSIHKEIKKLFPSSMQRIQPLIKNERGRGYRLNPAVFKKVTKK